MPLLRYTMNCSFKTILIFLALTCSSALYSQKKWTLQECIQYAFENNLNIKQQTLSIERDKNQLEQSKWAMGPSLSANAGYDFGWGRTANMQDLEINTEMTQYGNASIRASIDIFRGLQKVNTVKSNQAQLQVSGQEVEQLKNDISLQIANFYLQVLLRQEVLETARQSHQSVAEQVDRTRKLVEAGSLAHSSLLEIQAQFATEQVQVINAENALRSDYLSLIQLLDLSTETDFQIEVPNIQVDTNDFMGAPIDQLYYYSQILPQIRIGEFALQQRAYQLAVSKGQRFPTLSLSTGISSSYNPDYREVESIYQPEIDPLNPVVPDPIINYRTLSFLDQLKSKRNTYLSFSLSIPILSGRTIATNIRNAALGVRQAEIDMKNRQQALYKDIQQANNNALSALEQYKATLHNVNSMEESFRYVQQKLDVGSLNGTDFTVAKTNLFRAQSDNLQAKYNYVFQLKILDFYRGIPITL